MQAGRNHYEGWGKEAKSLGVRHAKRSVPDTTVLNQNRLDPTEIDLIVAPVVEAGRAAGNLTC